MPTVQVRKARNRTFSNYTLHEIVVKEITIEYASAPLARGPNSIFSNTNFAKYSMQPRDPRAHTHTRVHVSDGIRDRIDFGRVIRDEF